MKKSILRRPFVNYFLLNKLADKVHVGTMFVRQKTHFITNNDKKHNSSMDRIHDLSFGGERPLFGAHDVKLENITVTDL